MKKRKGRHAKRTGIVEGCCGFVLPAIALLIGYFSASSLGDERSSTTMGMLYGIGAAILLLGLAFLGVRRRISRISMNLRLGRVRAWRQFHVYGGGLFLLLLFMHTGFRAPAGQLTWWLYLLSIWVVVSGVVGMILQKLIPRMLTSALSMEVIYERIPELINEIRRKTEAILETASDSFQDFYYRNIAAALMTVRPRWIYYIDVTGGIQMQIKQFEHISKILSEEDKAKLGIVENYYRTKLELDAHYTLQKGLRLWLYLHVPASIMLCALTAAHILSVIVY